jgi:hypothetical protein
MSACIYPRKTSLHEGGFGAPSGLILSDRDIGREHVFLETPWTDNGP